MSSHALTRPIDSPIYPIILCLPRYLIINLLYGVALATVVVLRNRLRIHFEEYSASYSTSSVWRGTFPPLTVPFSMRLVHRHDKLKVPRVGGCHDNLIVMSLSVSVVGSGAACRQICYLEGQLCLLSVYEIIFRRLRWRGSRL